MVINDGLKFKINGYGSPREPHLLVGAIWFIWEPVVATRLSYIASKAIPVSTDVPRNPPSKECSRPY